MFVGLKFFYSFRHPNTSTLTINGEISQLASNDLSEEHKIANQGHENSFLLKYDKRRVSNLIFLKVTKCVYYL